MRKGRRQWERDEVHLRGHLRVKKDGRRHGAAGAVLVDASADLPQALARHGLADHRQGDGQGRGMCRSPRRGEWLGLRTRDADGTARAVLHRGLLLVVGGRGGQWRVGEWSRVGRATHIHRVAARRDGGEKKALAADGGRRTDGRYGLEGELIGLEMRAVWQNGRRNGDGGIHLGE